MVYVSVGSCVCTCVCTRVQLQGVGDKFPCALGDSHLQWLWGAPVPGVPGSSAPSGARSSNKPPASSPASGIFASKSSKSQCSELSHSNERKQRTHSSYLSVPMCYGLNCVPPPPDSPAKVLTSRTSGCDCIWREGLYRGHCHEITGVGPNPM